MSKTAKDPKCTLCSTPMSLDVLVDSNNVNITPDYPPVLSVMKKKVHLWSTCGYSELCQRYGIKLSLHKKQRNRTNKHLKVKFAKKEYLFPGKEEVTATDE